MLSEAIEAFASSKNIILPILKSFGSSMGTVDTGLSKFLARHPIMVLTCSGLWNEYYKHTTRYQISKVRCLLHHHLVRLMFWSMHSWEGLQGHFKRQICLWNMRFRPWPMRFITISNKLTNSLQGMGAGKNESQRRVPTAKCPLTALGQLLHVILTHKYLVAPDQGHSKAEIFGSGIINDWTELQLQSFYALEETFSVERTNLRVIVGKQPSWV